MSAIHFFSEDTDFTFQETEKGRTWIIYIASQKSKEISELNFIFCSDPYLHKLNVDYLQHDTLTDIITFPYSEDETIAGDIFISVDRVKENAQKFETSFLKELKRVMAHGVLHLCGYKDKSDDEKKEMRLQEDKAIQLWEESSE